jgi:serine phosphatase RsbU (regulator of sigma subunit)
MAMPIDYKSAQTSPIGSAMKSAPSEFEFEMEQERGRWLRRRFLWYCVLTMVLSLGSLVVLLMTDINEMSEATLWFSVVNSVVYLLFMFGAFVWTNRATPIYRKILLVAMFTYLTSSMWGIVVGRVTMSYASFSPSGQTFEGEFGRGLEQGVREAEEIRASTRAATGAASRPSGEPRNSVLSIDFGDESEDADADADTGDVTTQSTTQSATQATTRATSLRTSEARFVSNLLTSGWPALLLTSIWAFLIAHLFVSHTIACVFLPWTFRESVRPAALMCMVCLGVILFEVVHRQIDGAWLLVPLLLIPLMVSAFAPGSFWCWWRYSKFNKHFRSRFESQRYRQLTQELYGAQQIHESQMPAIKTSGTVQFSYSYEPMRLLGGDLIYVHEPRQRVDVLDVIVIDVTGHGIAAALTVNRLLGELDRTFAETDSATPDQVLCNLNRYVGLTMSRHQIYVTAIAMQIDAASNRLTYANAGHPHAILLRNGQPMRSLESTTMLLGAADSDDFQALAIDVEFGKGDLIVCYTDGASEAFAAYSSLMLGAEGVERMAVEFARTTPWDRLPHQMLEAVRAYRQSPPTDDTLIVAVKHAG